MKIKEEDVFIYLLNLSGAIVSQNSEISPEDSVAKALATLLNVKKASEAWTVFYDEDGEIKDPLDLLKRLEGKVSPEVFEKINRQNSPQKGETHDL
jgi:hypothetical protein